MREEEKHIPKSQPEPEEKRGYVPPPPPPPPKPEVLKLPSKDKQSKPKKD